MPSIALSPTNNRLAHKNLDCLFQVAISNVREEMLQNPYIEEAIAVLGVGRYRSAIGAFWNAVVDDLRNKVLHRSIRLFNKAVNVGREIKTYEDFQNYVSEEPLIEGAYKIGVIGWEAHKVLKHAKDTRNIFFGHPRSSTPSPFKALAMIEDCTKYVLREPYPVQIVDIDELMAVMATPQFDRSDIAISNSLAQLPEVYTTELINRLFSSYIHENAPSDLRSNIEVVAPILWGLLSKELKIQVVHRVDQEMNKGNTVRTEAAFKFVRMVKASAYLTITARRYVIKPLIGRMRDGLDRWATENECARELLPYAASIPAELVPAFVSAITHTFVGHTGRSYQWSRTNFYADGAAVRIPKMFEVFDDTAAAAFLDCIRKSDLLRDRVRSAVAKMERLRSLGEIVLRRVSADFPETKVLESLVASECSKEFWRLLGR
jgi:hypothetical protein